MESFFNPFDCSHENKKLVNRPDALNRDRYQMQCLDCGSFPSNAIGYEDAAKVMPLEKIPLFDVALIEKSEQKIKQIQTGRIDFVLEQFRPQYDKYLKTKAWKDKQQLVLKRANFLCEGCGVNKATQVHHFSYENLEKEYLWELAAVCKTCHDDAHLWKLEDRNSRAEMIRQRIFKELTYSSLFQKWFNNKFVSELDNHPRQP